MMLPWNFLKQYQQRLQALGSALPASQKSGRPKILTLWLLCSVLWLLLVCAAVAFLYWYHDQQWLVRHRLMLLLLALAGLALCVIVPVLWRVFAVLDGPGGSVALMKRSIYQRQTPIQARLDAFAGHLRQKYPLHWLNRHYILAVQGDPAAFSDVGEQLQRQGWAEVDQVYLVLMNELDDVLTMPFWRGQYHCPFDGVVLLRDLNSGESKVCGDAPQAWLDKFYALVHWKIPFAHIFHTDEALNDIPENLSWCVHEGGQSAATLRQNIYRHIIQRLMLASPSQKKPLLALLDEHADAKMDPEAVYAKEALAYCHAIGIQARQSRWWGQWLNLAVELHHHPSAWVKVPRQIRYAKVWIGVLLLLLLWIGVSFGRNLHEIARFKQEIKQVEAIQSPEDASVPLLDLQNHIVLRQRASLSSLMQLGFNHDHTLLTKALPVYGMATRKWFVFPADEQIVRVLQSLPLQRPQTADKDHALLKPIEQYSNDIALTEGFDALKAYLMLRYPKRVDNIYLTDYLSRLSLHQTPAQKHQMQQIFEFYSRQLPHQPSWLLAPDETLIRQSRAVLNDLYQQQQQDQKLYQSLLEAADQRFAPLTLADLAGKDSQLFWQNKQTLSGAYTARAWREWFEPELNKLNPAHYKNGSWVLNDQAKDDDGEGDIRKQIMALYQQDYFEHWQEFLSGIEWVPNDHLNTQVERLKQYADKKNSVLVKLLAAIEENTRIGYADHRTEEGKGVLVEFEPLIALIKTRPDQAEHERPLDQYQENLLAMYLQLQKIQGAGNQAAASQLAFNALLGDAAHASADFVKVQQSIDLQVANLGVQWQDIGRTLLSFPFDASKKIALQPALLNINQLWQQMVLLPWQQRFAHKYPLDKRAQQDVSLAELQQFIDPQRGVIAQFNRQYLNEVLVLVGNQWQINPALSSEEVAIDPAFVTQLNALNQLLEFVSSGDGTAVFELKFRPVPDVKQIRLVAAGQQWTYLNEKPYWHKVKWPISGEGDKKSAIEWVDIHDQHGRLEVLGDLGILRLLDKATEASFNEDGSYHLQWQIQGKKIDMDIKSLQTNDFITLLKLKGFDFPETVFKVEQYAD
ncbi:ImcF-related family protein [Neisseriaceae bacterium ESL0693]|nr:ImcF-related family protein [Neisseriaceae bacterium ESL0693]